jgi:hypothetical protein
MKTFLRLSVVFTILLFACNAWAQGLPQCPTTEPFPGVFVPQPPVSPGACFFDGTGLWSLIYVVDGAKVLGVLSFGTGENDFLRINPNLKAFWHQNDKGSAAALCLDWPNCGVDDYGWPNDETWFEGEANVKVNSAAVTTDFGFYFKCPLKFYVKGQLADNFGEGNKLDMLALTTMVQDYKQDPVGCRMSMTSIKIDPID